MGSSTIGTGHISAGGLTTGTSDDSYYIDPTTGNISEQVLHNYLDKVLQMSGLCMYVEYYNPLIDGSQHPSTDINGNQLLPNGACPQFDPSYDPLDSGFIEIINHPPIAATSFPAAYSDTTSQLGEDLQMISNLRPKMIFDAVYFWQPPGLFSGGPQDVTLSTGGNNALSWACNAAKMMIPYVHQTIDSDIIFQASISEYVNSSCNGFIIPNYVLQEYGYTCYPGSPNPDCYSPPPPYNHLWHLDAYGGYSPTFDFQKMLFLGDFEKYPTDVRKDDGKRVSILNLNPTFVIDIGSGSLDTRPDITQQETQMWYFFLATQYIDAGFECITLGDTFTTDFFDRNDVNITFTRGYHDFDVVGSFGHRSHWDLVSRIRAYAKTHSRRKFVLICGNQSNDFYYDPDPSAILPNWQRQLIFDFR